MANSKALQEAINAYHNATVCRHNSEQAERRLIKKVKALREASVTDEERAKYVEETIKIDESYGKMYKAMEVENGG